MEQENYELRKFVAPEIITGFESAFRAPSYVQSIGGSKVFLVSDEGVTEAGWTEKIETVLKKDNLDYIRYLDISPNPRDFEVAKGVEAYLGSNCDLIVVIGGGSAIDCAKGIGVIASNGKNIQNYEGVDKVTMPMPPLICIPTTAGSSADVSQFAIITNTEEKYKMALVSKGLVPDVSLIDPLVSTTMDPELTAETGIDALTHAVEAYVSNASSPITDIHALHAVRYIVNSLLTACREPQNIEARFKMMLGSLHAGLAFSNASLGLVHAMAHAMGGFLDLPHGLCNALLLENVVEFNFYSAAERYRAIAEIFSGKPLAGMEDEAVRQYLYESLKDFRRKLGVEDGVRRSGKQDGEIESLADKALNDACIVTNPRAPVKQEIIGIYGKIFI